MVLADAAYIADEAGAVTESERIKALAKYQGRHGISVQDAATVPTERLLHRQVKRALARLEIFRPPGVHAA